MSIEKAARIREWKSGNTPGPWRIFAFPTYRCNLKCGYCAKALVPDPPELRREISDERLLALVDESAEMGVREWIIGGGGEPMLRRELVMAMCEKIRGYGMHGVLQSNGTLFEESDIERLVRMGWNILSISLDGADAELNDRIRWKKSFDKLVSALEALNTYKAKYKRFAPDVNLAVVVSALNYDRLEELVDFAHRHKLHSLVFNEVYVHLDGLDNFVLSPDQARELPDIVRRCERKAEALGLSNNFTSFVNALGSVEGRSLPPPVPERADDVSRVDESVCFDPWLSLSIVSSGNVAPCCVFYEKHSDNIKNVSLADAWTGPYMTELRRNMLANTPPEPCQACQSDFIRQNWAVRDALASFHLTSVTPGQLVHKAFSTLRKNGVAGAVRRGREWYQIRRQVRDASVSKK